MEIYFDLIKMIFKCFLIITGVLAIGTAIIMITEDSQKDIKIQNDYCIKKGFDGGEFQKNYFGEINYISCHKKIKICLDDNTTCVWATETKQFYFLSSEFNDLISKIEQCGATNETT